MDETKRRFWNKVRKTRRCWIWTASKRNKGYGAFVYPRDGTIVQGRAHRYSWEIHHGPIPRGQCVLHNCPGGDNPACVRPSHLFLGTRADNNRDMCQKGRHVAGGAHCGEKGKYEKGESHHNAKLNASTVRKIRASRISGTSYGRLSKIYGLAIGYVYRLCNGKAWKHVI